MKKNILVLISCLFFLVFSVVHAQTPTVTEPGDSATNSADTQADKDVIKLKEKVANKVAQLRRQDQKAISGTVASIDSSIIKIKTENNDYQVKIDSALTNLFQIKGAVKSEIKISDIERDDYIIVTGPILDNVINANDIYKDEQYDVKSGKITEINKTDYYIKVLTSDKEEYMLDIEVGTKEQLLDIKTLIIEKTGFSKIHEGDMIHFVIKENQDSAKKQSSYRFSPQKILIIPQEYFIK